MCVRQRVICLMYLYNYIITILASKKLPEIKSQNNVVEAQYIKMVLTY